MDLTDEIKFGDLQSEERYKKLKRSLKLAHIKQKELSRQSESELNKKFKEETHVKGGFIHSRPWPSCSTINTDSLDVSYASRAGSEVLTSCIYLKNLVSKGHLHKPMATSSVKQFPETDLSVDDRTIMPPPSSCALIRLPAKRSAPSNSLRLPKLLKQTPLFVDNLSFTKRSYTDENCSSNYSENAENSQDFKRVKPLIRDFYQWRVILNEQGQLLIKGTLESGKVARSKAVSKRLSLAKLESIFKHTYCLHGNIVDEKNELPKYVYSKFYNGFPDDWENVYQIWRNYVAQGSKENYRWPTDVSLSDDDLNSEITDINQSNSEKKFYESNSLEKSTPHRSSGYISQDRNSNFSENTNKDSNLKDHSHFSTGNNTVEVTNVSNEKGNRNQTESSSDRSKGNLYAALNYAQTLKDIIFEDKLTYITQNLLNENCPKEYVTNVNDVIKILDYLLSYKIRNTCELEAKETRNEYKNDSKSPEEFQRHCSTPFSNVNEPVPDIDDVNKRIYPQSETLITNEYYAVNPKTINTQKVNLKTDSNNSESETYAGIRKIQVDRILRSKPYYSRFKGRKVERNSRNNKAKSIAEDSRNNLVYDSSVSFTEEELPQDHERGIQIRTKSHSNILQSKLNTSNIFEARSGSNQDKRHNRTPLEMSRKTNVEENRTRIEHSDQNPEEKKILSDKENIEENKQNGSWQNSEAKNTQNKYNLQIHDVNSNQRGKQKPTIKSSEIVDVLYKSRRPHKNQFLSYESDSNRQDIIEKAGEFKNSTFLKTVELTTNLETNTQNQEDLIKGDTFGSKNNPKSLEAWTPQVVLDGNDYHLVFEGTLLNALDRPVQKKFTSNPVLRRISSTIFETTDHQFYKLFGELHKTKSVPKELLPQCRNGCPVKIDQFCINWVKLTGENNLAMQRLQENTAEIPKNISSSSRGRRILPPLNFWADERLIMKDDNAVYKPGDPKDFFISSAIDTPKNPRNAQDQDNQSKLDENNKNKCSTKNVVNPKSNLLDTACDSNEAIKNSIDSEEGKRLPKKNKLAHKLIFSSSDSEETLEEINKRSKRKSRQSLDLNVSPSRSGKQSLEQNQNPKNFDRTYGLRKRKKIGYKVDTDIESDTDSIPGDANKKKKISVKSRPAQTVRCTYQKNVPAKDGILSDDQVSSV